MNSNLKELDRFKKFIFNFKFTILFLYFLISAGTSAAMHDSIFHNGNYRTFIVHLPQGVNPARKYPIVINFHGLNSNANDQKSYSGFNRVADSLGFIVVYPDALKGFWDLMGTNDVDFISTLTDTIRTRYNCNSCLFLTGMSMGGFMTYKLACTMPKQITAIAVVTGNMPHSLQNSCMTEKGIPVMHFHGTDDIFVKFSGGPGVPPVDSTILWWVQNNNCKLPPLYTKVPDLNTTDNCTVEKYLYTEGRDASSVTFFKVVNGGHTWPGTYPSAFLGNTNRDIDASAVIGDFFFGTCFPSSTGMSEITKKKLISIYPNPASKTIKINYEGNILSLVVLDINGKTAGIIRNISGKLYSLPPFLPSGLYIIKIETDQGILFQKIIIN